MRGVHLSFDSEVSRWRYADFSFTRLKSVYKSKVGVDFAGLDFLSLEECMMVHGYSVRERDRVFQILETYGFEADFMRKDLVGQLELAPPSVEKFLRKLEQTGLIVSGNGYGLYRMNGNCAVKGEGK